MLKAVRLYFLALTGTITSYLATLERLYVSSARPFPKIVYIAHSRVTVSPINGDT